MIDYAQKESRVKKRLLLLLAVGALSACDEKGAPQAFTPEMASFSNEFEFDPLRGPVKAFSQTLYDEHDQVVKWVKGRLSSEGCLTCWHLRIGRIKPARRWCWTPTTTWMRKATKSACVCRANVSWRKCPRRGSPGKPMITGLSSPLAAKSTATYRYDREGYPLGKTTIAKGEQFTVASTPSSDPRKKMDYTAVSTFNDRALGNVSQTCDYDSHDNPVSCELKVVDDSVQPALTRHYTIKSTIDYY
jgi:hypothetical protein